MKNLLRLDGIFEIKYNYDYSYYTIEILEDDIGNHFWNWLDPTPDTWHSMSVTTTNIASQFSVGINGYRAWLGGFVTPRFYSPTSNFRDIYLANFPEGTENDGFAGSIRDFSFFNQRIEDQFHVGTWFSDVRYGDYLYLHFPMHELENHVILSETYGFFFVSVEDQFEENDAYKPDFAVLEYTPYKCEFGWSSRYPLTPECSRKKTLLLK